MTCFNRVSGLLTLSSPLFCAAPKEDGGANNHTRTMTQPVLTGGLRDFVPFFPGNDIRGRLRRKAAARVMDALKRNGQKISPALYGGLCTGAKDNAPEQDASIEESLRARAHVFIGLFGGGKRMMRSRFAASDLIPVLASTIAAGMVPSHYTGQEEGSFVPFKLVDNVRTPLRGFEIVQKRQQVKIDDVFRVMRPEEIETFIDNAREAVGEYQSAIIENKGARKSAKTAEKDEKVAKLDMANIFTLDAIIPGTHMYLQVDLQDSLTQAQRGLLFMALADLINEQALGGFVRAGFGRFAPTLEATIDGENVPLFNNKNGHYTLSSFFDEYVSTVQSELDALTTADLMEFYESRGEKK